MKTITVAQAISLLDSQLPNTCTLTEKLSWLSRVDLQVKKEVLDTHGAAVAFAGYTPDTDPDTPLLLCPPYDECYLRYMEAQIHYTNGEMTRYQNAMILFNAVYAAYAAWYNRTHMPASAGNFRF